MQKSFNIERFHNLLALNLGYKRILNKSYDGQTMSYNVAEGYESIRSSVKLEDILNENLDSFHAKQENRIIL
jgi:hypothetical protein